MAKYMQGINFYTTHEEAVSRSFRLTSDIVVEKHKDGSGAIVFLSDASAL